MQSLGSGETRSFALKRIEVDARILFLYIQQAGFANAHFCIVRADFRPRNRVCVSSGSLYHIEQRVAVTVGCNTHIVLLCLTHDTRRTHDAR